MTDQATELRKLVLRAARQRAAIAAPPPKLVAVMGARPGVGTTAIAINISLALGHQGMRAVLVDANLLNPSLGRLSGIGDGHGIIDVLAARRDIHEVLQRGPGGLQVIPGDAAATSPPPVDASAEKRLFQQIQALGLFTDVVVADIGSIANPLARPFWQAASASLLVATCEPAELMESYAAIKRLSDRPSPGPVRLLVNRAPTPSAAEDIADKLDRSCRRFLDMGCRLIGSLPDDPSLAGSAKQIEASLLARPPSDATRVVHALVSELLAMGESGTGHSGAKAA